MDDYITERAFMRLRSWANRHGFNLLRGRDDGELVAERGTLTVRTRNVIALVSTVAQLAEVR